MPEVSIILASIGEPSSTGLSGINWNTIILGIIGLVSTTITGGMAYFMQKLTTQAKAAAVEVKEVKEVLVGTNIQQNEKLDGIAKTANETHTYVNGMRGETLRVVAELTKWKAGQEPTKENIAAAKAAEEAYAAHKEQEKLHEQKQKSESVTEPAKLPGSIKDQLSDIKTTGDDTQQRVKKIELKVTT